MQTGCLAKPFHLPIYLPQIAWFKLDSGIKQWNEKLENPKNTDLQTPDRSSFDGFQFTQWTSLGCSFVHFISSIYLCTSFLKLLHFIFALHSSNWRNSFLQINFCGSFLKFKFEVSRSLYLNKFVQVCQTIGQGTFKLIRTLRVQFREFISFQILGILYLFFDLFEFNEFACSFLKVICLHVTCLKLPCNSLVTTLCNSLFKSFFALHKSIRKKRSIAAELSRGASGRRNASSSA